MTSLMNDAQGDSKTSSGSRYNGRATVAGLEQKMGDAANSIGKTVGAVASDFSGASMEAYKSSKKYVEENPGKGVLIGAGVGLLAGILLAVSNRSSQPPSSRS